MTKLGGTAAVLVADRRHYDCHLLLLLLTPIHQLYAQRFNANATLLALW